MSNTRRQSAPIRAIALALVALAASASSGASFAAVGAGTMAPAPAGHASATASNAAPAAPKELIDINSASRAQLKTLPGIGDAEADKIIAARPYLSKADLVSKKVLGAGPYVSIKRQIIAIQTTPLQLKP